MTAGPGLADPSLEEVFVQTTGQDDFTPVARQILDLMQP